MRRSPASVLWSGPQETSSTPLAQDEVGRGQLGYSYMRLMPKESGVRPVVNLRRKITKRQGNTQPKSINSMLQEVFAAMNFEKVGPSSHGCRSEVADDESRVGSPT